jgi:tetratricopeptide (TPR) repeat protein
VRLVPERLDSMQALAVLLHCRGIEHYNAGCLAEAEAAFREAVRLAPKRLDSMQALAVLLHCRGIEHYNAGCLAEAEAAFRETVRLAPERLDSVQALAALLHCRGIEYYNAGCLAEAEAAFRETVRLAPERLDSVQALAALLHRRGIEHYNAGCLAEAEAAFREAVRLAPDIPGIFRALVTTLHLRGIEYYNTGRLVEAEATLREIIRLTPDDRGSLLVLSRIMYSAGVTEEALSIARRLYNLEPDDPDYVGWFCQTKYEAGETKGILNLASRFVKLVSSGKAVKQIVPEWILQIYGEMLIREEKYNEAREIFERLAQNGFRKDVCVTVIASACLAEGQSERALEILKPVVNSSSWSSTFVTASIAGFHTKLRKTSSELPSRCIHENSSQHSISLSSLAVYGRFGHQIGDYLTAYLYVKNYGLVLETPDWVGHYFFELDDPILTPNRYVTRQGQEKRLRQLDGNDPPLAGVDIWSPGLVPLTEHHRETVQSRLRPRALWFPYLKPALDKLGAAGRTIVALHLRRGDRVIFNDITPTSLYLEWLSEIWPTLEEPVLFLASDDIEAVKQDFSHYRPHSLSDLIEPWPGNEYLQDFYILMNCDVLGISTGSFASSAALLNKRARLCVGPDKGGRKIIPFYPYS